ncbi:UDP-N-acetyl-D-glucosamine dehydrogenase [Aliidiomarina minuta]|uniref:UDP-N-acetyl-D-glucosamine dehydrogenase n=1 Tax=Aliidiomarina minuta TaxID=880057 RepID=A0A432W785_9GAMM|nr:Gfo/Idh/MocA family oxidoreductase [Aliidiomarina minuta]RUO25937.1 UDP-N-acetyl-D-glucosamine dehydrogenase [Aliidiomarina minuta]
MQRNAKLRTGVVGLGYFGAFHAEKHATLPSCELVAVADTDLKKVHKVSMEHDVQGFNSHHDLIGQVDAVSIATPAESHYQVARDFLQEGVHVLLEKPIASNAKQARELIQLANQHHCILQIGHLERFNPVFIALPQSLQKPEYIESHRLTQFQSRGQDVNVVLDLMIHDIDLVHALIPSEVIQVQAKGVCVYSKTVDLVNAILYFANGSVANLTASRASIEPRRAIHLFQEQAYTCLDMQHKTITTQQQKGKAQPVVDTIRLQNEDTLRAEIASFAEAVQNQKPPLVSGDDGLKAISTARRICLAMQRSNPDNPLPLREETQYQKRHIAYDRHPETREIFFSRPSLVKGL